MSEFLEDIRRYGGLGIIIISIFAIFASGIFFGITYHIMEITETALIANDCVIADNIYFSTCQEMWSISVYPFLALRELIVWFSFFFIFALVMGLLIVGYQSGRSPVLIGLLFVFVMIITYLGIEVSNVYRTMLDNEVFRTIMTPFTVYNKVMLLFPWFTFFVGLLSTMLGIVNYQRTSVNKIATSDELNY